MLLSKRSIIRTISIHYSPSYTVTFKHDAIAMQSRPRYFFLDTPEIRVYAAIAVRRLTKTRDCIKEVITHALIATASVAKLRTKRSLIA